MMIMRTCYLEACLQNSLRNPADLNSPCLIVYGIFITFGGKNNSVTSETQHFVLYLTDWMSMSQKGAGCLGVEHGTFLPGPISPHISIPPHYYLGFPDKADKLVGNFPRGFGKGAGRNSLELRSELDIAFKGTMFLSNAFPLLEIMEDGWATLGATFFGGYWCPKSAKYLWHLRLALNIWIFCIQFLSLPLFLDRKKDTEGQ